MQNLEFGVFLMLENLRIVRKTGLSLHIIFNKLSVEFLKTILPQDREKNTLNWKM